MRCGIGPKTAATQSVGALTPPGVAFGEGPARKGYSPMTAQRNPNMMKTPLNIMIRPMPPYGEFAPS